MHGGLRVCSILLETVFAPMGSEPGEQTFTSSASLLLSAGTGFQRSGKLPNMKSHGDAFGDYKVVAVDRWTNMATLTGTNVETWS
jgi:hypothetical protein